MNPDKRDSLENESLEDIIVQLAALALNRQPNKITPDTPLFSTQQGFDSFALVEFVLRIESSFGIQIPDQDLDPDIFYSVSTIASYIHSRLNGRA